MSERGIDPELSAPYTPEQIGVAERRNRMLLEKMRVIVEDSRLQVVCGMLLQRLERILSTSRSITLVHALRELFWRSTGIWSSTLDRMCCHGQCAQACSRQACHDWHGNSTGRLYSNRSDLQSLRL